MPAPSFKILCFFSLLLNFSIVVQTTAQHESKEALLKDIRLQTMSNLDSAATLLIIADSIAAAASDDLGFQLEVLSKHGRLEVMSNNLAKAKDIYTLLLTRADKYQLADHQIEARNRLCLLHYEIGELDLALEYALVAEKILIDNWSTVGNGFKADVNSYLGLIYLGLNQFEDSNTHYRKALLYIDPSNNINRSIFYYRLAQLYWQTEQIDSFLSYKSKYIAEISSGTISSKDQYHNHGLYQNKLGALDHKKLIRLVPEIRSKGNSYEIETIYTLIAEYFLENKQFYKAEMYIDTALIYNNTKKVFIKPFQIRYQVLAGAKKYKEAIIALEKLVSLEKTTINSESKSNIDRLKIEYETERKEKEIAQNKIELDKAKNTRNILLFIAFIIAILAFALWQRYKRIKDKSALEKSNYDKELVNLQLASLRAQMNPHFLFNTLNSINWYIIKNKSTEASKYLTKFSKLMRLILENSKAERITLSKELETLKLYTELEAVRFEGQFSYQYDVDAHIETDQMLIPPLIFQPFIENAIWHGLVHKPDKGEISLSISANNDFLICTLEDNGIGRKAAQAIADKSTIQKKSSGIEITRMRIEGMAEVDFKPIAIEDLYDLAGNAIGTKVILNIPIVQNTQTTTN